MYELGVHYTIKISNKSNIKQDIHKNIKDSCSTHDPQRLVGQIYFDTNHVTHTKTPN